MLVESNFKNVGWAAVGSLCSVCGHVGCAGHRLVTPVYAGIF